MPELNRFESLESGIIELNIRSSPKNGIHAKPIVRDLTMARYDYGPVNQMSRQILKQIGFTFAQRNFAIKLITKYKRQWLKLGYDVSNIDKDTPTIYGMREVDTKREVTIQGENITLQFLYHPRIVASLYTYKESRSAGSVDYNTETKVWELSITPENLEFATAIAQNHNFEITAVFSNTVLELSNDRDYRDYKDIRLDIIGDQLILENAPVTLTDYITDNIGDVVMSNFLKLTALAGQMAYSLSDNVINKVLAEHNDFAGIILNRKSYVNSEQNNLVQLLEKVNKFDFSTIVIYTTAPVDMYDLAQYKVAMPEYDFEYYNKNKNARLLDATTPSRKTVILTNKVIPVVPDVIISLQGFSIGPSRKAWFNSAAKNIYFCEDLDIKIKKAIKKNERNINHKRRGECEANRAEHTDSETTNTKI